MTKRKKPKAQSLSEITKIWDEKLKQSGFKDIENRKTGMLKSWAGTVSLDFAIDGNFGMVGRKGEKQRYSGLATKEGQAEYFRLAAQCLHEAQFKSPLKKIIWEYHSEGLSVKEIADLLDTTMNKVRRLVENMAIEFGLSFIKRKKGKNKKHE